MIHRNLLVLFFCLFVASFFGSPNVGLAAGAGGEFFEAGSCATALRKNLKAMKYRDKWEKCINKFQVVYNNEPKGPWAPASLYNIGTLYLELFKYSRNPSDQKKGADFLVQVQKKFPDSVYRERSAAELQKSEASASVQDDSPRKEAAEVVASGAKLHLREPLKMELPVPVSPTQAKYLRAGESCFNKLRTRKPTEATRREWMLCVGRFHNSYLEDPSGPLSAQALYMEGVLYNGLYNGLKFRSDHRAAQENFEKVVREYPDSPFADKAAGQLKAMAADSPVPKTTIRPPAPQKGPPEQPAPQAKVSPSAPRKPVGGEPGLAVVQELRHWSDPSYTRVVVYADQEVDFIHHLLKKDPDLNKPPRLYVDLNNSTMGEGVQTNIPINDDLLSYARAARYTVDSVRVVVDIKSFDNYKVFSLHDPFRIVIDVWGKSGPAQAVEESAENSLRGSTSDRNRKVPRGALARQLALGVRRIVVDPGHGGKDFGAPGFIPGVHEKDVVLAISKRVAAKIRDDLGLEAILTRTGDRYLTLEERTAFANTHHADLFVSIHTNASRDPRAYGIETYFLNLATDDESIRVAAMENATSTKNISDLHSILNDLLKNAKINESSRLAELVQNSLVKSMNHRGYDRIKDKGVKQAPFYVLLGARMPSILVEASFISNREECHRLVTSTYQQHLAESIVQGLRAYIREINPTALHESPRLRALLHESSL
ncbi:MAG: N-acetylmuramoyl-L-alanine amidase [Deltaproteobacteria bacterium]|nr:MAG: N-acetylmuramoyl-L-alanine amidase [Deltaproteobacteria bacterium]